VYHAFMGLQGGGRRDFQGLEGRRRRAAELFAAGEIMANVARLLQVSRQSASRWYTQWKKGGVDSLRAAGRAGRPPKLDTTQRQRIDLALRDGARAHGFTTDLWTLPRIAIVIERVTGVRYHSGHVWRILRSLNWSLQRPGKRARERNDEAVRQWVAETWPAIKKKPAARARGLSSRTKAGSRRDRPSAEPGHREARRRS